MNCESQLLNFVRVDYDYDCENESDGDDKSDADFDVSMTEDEDECEPKDERKELYPIEKRKEIVDYWQNDGNPRKLSSVQSWYKLVTGIEVLRKWKYRIYGEGTNVVVFSPSN